MKVEQNRCTLSRAFKGLTREREDSPCWGDLPAQAAGVSGRQDDGLAAVSLNDMLCRGEAAMQQPSGKIRPTGFSGRL
jgi:hypothetical protein